MVSFHVIRPWALDTIYFLYPCVEAERVQVGAGLFTFKDVSRGFYNLATLFAVSIPFVYNVAVSCRYHTRVKLGRYIDDISALEWFQAFFASWIWQFTG